MLSADFSPFPHLSWLGAWTAVGDRPATVEVHLRQVNHCLIYNAGTATRVRWIHHRRDYRFAAGVGTVRFCPADDDPHTLIGRCDPGHRFYTLPVPRGRMLDTAAAEGVAVVPELRHSVSHRDSVLTVCMRTLAGGLTFATQPSAEEQEAAPLAVVARDLGFSSHSHFTRRFTKTTGMTPARYRHGFRRVVG